jgi:hypothetical protein
MEKLKKYFWRIIFMAIAYAAGVLTDLETIKKLFNW